VAIAHHSAAFPRAPGVDSLGDIVFSVPTGLLLFAETANMWVPVAFGVRHPGLLMEVHRVVASSADNGPAIERNRVRPPGLPPCSVHGASGRICSDARGSPAWSSPQRSQGRGQPMGDGERGIQVRPERYLLARGRRHASIWPAAATCSLARVSRLLCNLRSEVSGNGHVIQYFKRIRKASVLSTRANWVNKSSPVR
jgi:hypothetical protein